MEDISNIYFTSVIDTYTQLLLTFTYQYNSKDVTFYTAAETSPYIASIYDIDTTITGTSQTLYLTLIPLNKTTD